MRRMFSGGGILRELPNHSQHRLNTNYESRQQTGVNMSRVGVRPLREGSTVAQGNIEEEKFPEPDQWTQVLLRELLL